MALPPNLRLLVIGVGQEWRGDDAAGLLVARCLREMVRPEVMVLENSGSMTHLLDAWPEADAVILADAIRGGGRPGEIFRFPVHEKPLPTELFPATSSHAWGVAQAVALGRVLRQLPPVLVVYGIEGQDFGIGQEPSPVVAQAIPEVARRIRQEIEEFLV
ncbi:MAG: hydrogenase maturation protease [Deltaproteobacteria bacterium]|nr:hydrogenase maturation protease [Deltaproteobacteria bacterium]